MTENLDRLRESMVRILKSEQGETMGSGFIIREDGYSITCHHVIHLLDSIWVEYQDQKYQARWCEEYSNPDVDIAVLKIEITNAKPVTIIHPKNLSTAISVYGFPPKQQKFFPEGFNFNADRISVSPPLNTLATYPHTLINFNNPWNKLPNSDATFKSYKLDTKVEPGTSGGAVLSESLGGVVGIIQCSKSDASYVIRWDNILEILDKLNLNPEIKAICEFLEAIENDPRFKSLSLFHTKQPVLLKNQYIPIQVTLERRFKHEIETTFSHLEGEEELKRIYALKGYNEEKIKEEIRKVQVDWSEARKENKKIMILADPGMGKTSLVKMETGRIAREEREKLRRSPLTPLIKGGIERIDKIIFPLFLRLSDLAENDKELITIIPEIIKRDYPKIIDKIEESLQKKLNDGKCLLLLDALDEVSKEKRENLKEKLDRFTQSYPCAIYCTSRIVGYGGNFLSEAKEVEIVPFGQKQIEEYIETWFINAADYLENKSVSAKGLLQELQKKPQIRGLAQNPLLLFLICSLYQKREITLPARQVQLYEKAIHCMLHDWRKNRDESINIWKEKTKLKVLTKLAYDFSCKGKQIFTSE